MATSTAQVPATRRKRDSRVSWTVLTLVSLAITGFFVGQYATGTLDRLAENNVGLATTYANRPAFVQGAFYIHIISAGLALALSPFQFSKVIRRRYLTVHRWIGRIAVVSIAFGSASGMVMACFNSTGFVGFFGFGALAALWGWTTYRGYKAVREGDLASHQAWMIRSFALTFAAPTLRLWLGVLAGIAVLLPSNPGTDYNVYAAVPFLCWLPNIVVAELLIRRRNLPGLRFSPSPTSRRAAAKAAVKV